MISLPRKHSFKFGSVVIQLVRFRAIVDVLVQANQPLLILLISVGSSHSRLRQLASHTRDVDEVEEIGIASHSNLIAVVLRRLLHFLQTTRHLQTARDLLCTIAELIKTLGFGGDEH